jgi:hypothetical protein
MNKKYKDIIEWLEHKAIQDPENTERMVQSNIQIVSLAFNKPYDYVDRLVHRKGLDELTKDEKKIIEFYFKLFRKRMN